MTDLEKNRVYDIGEIETLKSSALSLLGTGINSCLSWDDAISQLKSLQSKTPVKSQELSSALDGAGTFYQSEYEVEKCWIEGALNNITTNIPVQDAAGARLLEPLNENLQLVMGMIEDLAGCIEAAGTNLTLSEFQEKIEGVKQEWEDTSLEENIEEFETSYLGMVENISYSDDMFFDAKALIQQNVDNATFLSVYDALTKLSDIPESEIKQNAIDNAKILSGNNTPLSASDYIENQSQWGNVKFGEDSKTNIARSGCGIIATYNALYALGESSSSQTMVDLISYYERDGAVLGGAWGVSPDAIEDYFIGQGYRVTSTNENGPITINMIGKHYETVIVTAYNDENDITQQVHTVSITKETNGTYTVHNAFQKDASGIYVSKSGYLTLQEAIDNMSNKQPLAINVIGISNAE